jgi:hypothetical protein
MYYGICCALGSAVLDPKVCDVVRAKFAIIRCLQCCAVLRAVCVKRMTLSGKEYVLTRGGCEQNGENSTFVLNRKRGVTIWRRKLRERACGLIKPFKTEIHLTAL